MNNHHFKVLAISILLFNITDVFAVAVSTQSWGAHAYSDISANCPNVCRGGPVLTDSAGVEGDNFAFASTATEYANSRASSYFSGPTALPVLKAESFADSGRGAVAVAQTVQKYTYTGTDEQVFNLNLSLHGSRAGDRGSVWSQYAVIISQDGTDLAEVLNGDSIFTDFGTLIYEYIPDAQYNGFDIGVSTETTLVLPENSTDQTVTGGLEFDLIEGDIFWVVANLYTVARNDSSADAFNTATMSFTNNGHLDTLVASASPVPVPAAFWLFLSGAGLASKLRRKQIS